MKPWPPKHLLALSLGIIVYGAAVYTLCSFCTWSQYVIGSGVLNYLTFVAAIYAAVKPCKPNAKE